MRIPPVVGLLQRPTSAAAARPGTPSPARRARSILASPGRGLKHRDYALPPSTPHSMLPSAPSLYPRFLVRFACLLALAAAQFAQATWLEQDTFESYPAGAPPGTPWTLSGSGITVEADSLGNSGQFLAQGGESGATLRRALTSAIPANSTAATLFYRFRTSGGSENQSIGLTDVAAPSNWTDFRVQIAVVGNVLQIRDGATTRDYTGIAGNTWHRLWVVVNNHANTYRLYLQGTDDAEPVSVTVAGQSTFAFRTNSSGPLTTVFGRVGSGTFSPVHYDDFYLTLAENLTLPVASFDEADDWWRTELYRAGWTPPSNVNFFTDPFLQDFSYAGYRRGEEPIPEVASPVFDVTDPAYGADPTGISDSTAAIQAAIDAAVAAGGGVVFLPAGTYRVAPVGSNPFALRIQANNIVLRGAGVGQTHILNTETNMRTRSVILVEAPSGGNWRTATGTPVAITADLMGPSMVIPVADTSSFQVGDWVAVRADLTTELAADLNMGDLWNTQARRDGLGGILFYRKVTAVDAANNHLHIDAPTRFALQVRDNARVHHTVELLEQVGLEDFSIGNLQHSGTSGWGENDYNNASLSAYEVHSSQLVTWRGARDSWMQSVHSYRPPANTKQVHMLSNGVVLHNTRGLTLRDVSMERAQYGGGGGNGYMIRMSSAQETLVQDSRAAWSRHGFVFSGMQTSGNVIHRGLAEETKWSAEGTTNGSGSDHHMHFSQSNLIDTVTVDRDYFEAAWRGTWGTIPHGMTATHTTYWNIEGLRYGPDSQNTIIHTEQFAYGYVIGTRGPASNVLRRTNQTSRTDPADIIEGVGQGDILYPFSLYEDQLARRLDQEFDPGPLYDDATLVAVLGVTDPEPGTQTGTSGDPITWSVNVPETVTALAPADIVAVDFAVVQLFSDGGYSTEITVGNTLALTESTPTIAYVLVTAEDQVTKLHYSVSISRVQAFSVTYNANGGGNAPVDANDYLAGETATVLGAGAMTRAVYEFTTWNTAPDGNGVTFLPGDTFEIQDDITLYAQWRYVLAQYNFGQAGPTTPPSGVFATVTAGEVQGWGDDHGLSTDASPGSGSYDSTPILTILKNAGANYDVGFFFDLEIPEGAGLNLSRLAFDASSGGSAGRKFKLGYVIDPVGAPTEAVQNLLGEQAPPTTRYEWTPYEVDLAGISELQNLSGVTVRFVWSVSISNQWSMDFDSITLNADVAVQDAPATVLYVNHDASGANNGSSWANAFTSLRDALAAAQAGQEIWVAAGTYNPFVSNRATDTFLLPSGVAVYGGFAGTESERDQRDWLAHETILSGHIEGQTNIRHIVTATGAEDARIDGFTIHDGHSDGENPYTDGVGAAVFVGQGEGRLTLANCRIVDNHAQLGGVVYFDANTNDPELRIENTVFEDNAIGSEWARGALQIRSNAAEVWIEDSRFENNPSGIFSEAGTLQVLRSQFLAQTNIAVDINYHGALNDFVNCVFDQNGGGAIRMVNSQQLRVANCVFTGNTNPYGSGGALNIGQGRFEVYNSTFYGNSADEGAAIAWSYGWAGDATSLIHNSIFWGNTGANVILLERYSDDSMTLELRNNLLQGGTASVGTWQDPVLVVENLIDSNPLFVDASDLTGSDGLWGTADDGLRLQAASPAVNTGLASLLPADWLDVNANADFDESLPLDLMGAARVQGGQPSLGAYETLEQGPPAPDAYADWAAANNITGGLADETGGVANLLRYALGGDATTPLAGLLPEMQSTPTVDGLSLTLTFHRIDDPLLTYAVWFSEDLEDWGATPVWQGTGAHEGEPGGFAVEVLVPTPVTRGFLRLEVTR